MGRAKLSVVLIVVCVVECLAMTYDELEDFAEHLKKTSQLSPVLRKGVEPDNYDEDEDVSDHAWEDSGKFEGDLILNERQRRLIIEDVAEGLSRNGIKDGTKKWPDNEVIYYIQVEHFTSDQIQAIESGIEDLARASCVKFRRYIKGDRDAVVIQGSRRGCFSQVGYQGGYQVLNLSGRHPVGRGCFRHGTVVHELLHTLGFYHMQSSPDRDDYVNVIWSNIIQPARHNFRKYNSFAVSDFGVGYDYDSVLHYSRRAFSSNGQDTIVPKQSGVQIGQRLGLSDKDTQKLNKMYCDADSDNGQADESPSKKTETKKKNGKNKPFEGHGIGYHQGKAVAIKLLPAAETYKLPDVPSFHVFDYFSKEPQILSTSENEAFRIGKEIAYSYNPPDMTIVSLKNELPVEFKTEPGTQPYGKEIKSEIQNDNYGKVAEVKEIKDLKEKQVSNSEITSDKSTQDGLNNGPEAVNSDPDLINAFDRLSKIIKLHVYPSQTPDLSIYKVNERYINHYDPPEIKKPSEELISLTPMKEDKLKDDKMNSAMKFINNFYDFSADKSFSYSLEKPHGESAKYKTEQIRNNIKDTSEVVAPNKDSNKKKHIIPFYTMSFPLNKQYEDEYVSTSGFKLPEQIQSITDKNEYKSIYSPKTHNDENPTEDEDEWHQNYTPFYPEHDYYTGNGKDSLKGPEIDGNTHVSTHSSSIPVKTQEYPIFHVPTQKIKNWYKIKNASYEER